MLTFWNCTNNCNKTKTHLANERDTALKWKRKRKFNAIYTREILTHIPLRMFSGSIKRVFTQQAWDRFCLSPKAPSDLPASFTRMTVVAVDQTAIMIYTLRTMNNRRGRASNYSCYFLDKLHTFKFTPIQEQLYSNILFAFLQQTHLIWLT